ncbi:MAG: hypothetical protein KA783_05330 [Chitinophagales bacterium]|nr:6-phosphogluconate dehydrogenase [Sphingobacteriales bacterium]MBP6664886.1 hypothetical protein [Chitinophagales bacterium]MBP7533846.1 hypothetical protein [Chitinophagales bacterium]
MENQKDTTTAGTEQSFSGRMQETGKKVKSTARKIFLLLLFLSVIGLGLFFWISSWTYSEGNRAGYLVKISEKGYVFKTYEGQLSLGPLGSFNAMNPTNVWAFSAGSNAYKELQQYEGKYVTLHYREILRNFPWQGDTKYIVDDVDLVNQ